MQKKKTKMEKSIWDKAKDFSPEFFLRSFPPEISRRVFPPIK